MGTQIINMMIKIATSCVSWFDQILSETGTSDIYLSMVFVFLLCGFLLSNFGNAFHSGSDIAADAYSKGSDYAKKRSSRGYRLGSDHKLH